jgi:hypothetical protein
MQKGSHGSLPLYSHLGVVQSALPPRGLQKPNTTNYVR